MATSKGLAAFLERTVAAELPLLRAIPDGPETSRPNRRGGVGWSRREELGHLIDSAVNNHNRFVRAALQPSYEGPDYEQNGWVAAHGYAGIAWPTLVDAWHSHNGMLVPVVAAIPDGKLDTPCRVGADAPISLAELIDSYVLHMQHHLDQIHRREKVTSYPRG